MVIGVFAGKQFERGIFVGYHSGPLLYSDLSHCQHIGMRCERQVIEVMKETFQARKHQLQERK